jgi:hypothetical protein
MLAGQMAALAQDDLKHVATIQQQNMAKAAEDLAQSANLISQHSKDLGLSAEAQRMAADAAMMTQKAQQSAATAAAQMAATPPGIGPAMQAQQVAAEALGQAATALSQLGAALAQQQAVPPQQRPLVEGQQLAEAFRQTSEAAVTAEFADMGRAAELLAGLAAAANASVGQMGLSPFAIAGQGSGQGFGTSGTGTGLRPNDPRMVTSRLEGSLDDLWARFRGNLKDEIRQGDVQQGPGEYRDMIARYFEILAKQRRDSKK